MTGSALSASRRLSVPRSHINDPGVAAVERHSLVPHHKPPPPALPPEQLHPRHRSTFVNNARKRFRFRAASCSSPPPIVAVAEAKVARDVGQDGLQRRLARVTTGRAAHVHHNRRRRRCRCSSGGVRTCSSGGVRRDAAGDVCEFVRLLVGGVERTHGVAVARDLEPTQLRYDGETTLRRKGV